MPSRIAAPAAVGRVQFQQAELALGEQNTRLHIRRGLQRQIDDAVNRQRGRDLDDEAVLALEGRVAAPARGRAEIGRELRLQVMDRQIDPQFSHD